MSKKKKILAIPADTFACGHYRIIEPYGKLAAIEHDGLEFEVYDSSLMTEVPLSMFVMKLAPYDAIVFQRIFDEKMLAVMIALKNAGKKVFMEIDDDLFNVSQTSTAWQTWKRGGKALTIFTKALGVADAVHVSTPELAELYSSRSKSIHVFYNGIDVSNVRYAPENSKRSLLPNDKTVVMWSGSSTHYDSMRVICRELKQVFDQRPNAIFALAGNIEFLEMINIKDEQKIHIQPVKMKDYYPIPSMGDIALSPVVVNSFNNCKSELKCLENGIWRIPVISSPASPYLRFNEMSSNANVIVKKNKGQNWAKEIAKMIDYPEYRKELGRDSRRAVLEHYDLDKINQKRIEFFENFLLK